MSWFPSVGQRARAHALITGVALVGAMLSAPHPAHGQAVTGTILGTVTDNSGAVMPGVTITVTNVDTGRSRVYVTDGNGEYTAPSLPTGTYTVGAELTGFKTRPTRRRHARCRSARPHRSQARSRRDDRVGQTSSRETPLVQTSSSELGTTVEQRADRGAAAERPQLRQPDPHHSRRAARHSRARTSTAPAASPGAPRPRSRPTASARATTTTCSTASTTTRPGCRRSSSSRASTRSTSSSCRPAPTRRSSAARSAASSTCRSSRAPTSCAAARFEFHRNDAFDANNFFNNRANRAKPDFKQNQFGGTVGGAVVQGQDVLLRRLPGPPRDPGADGALDGPDAGDARRRLLAS